MEQKLSDTLVKAIDRSNPMMQNLQLASRFNKLVEEGGGSGYTLETLSLNKDSAPVTISYEGKSFVFLGKIGNGGEFIGFGGTASNLLNERSVTIKGAGGATAGIVSIDPNAKTITYTPNTSYNMGYVNITKLII